MKFSFRLSVLRNETRTQDMLIKEQDCATRNGNFHCVRGEVEENNWLPVGFGRGYFRMRVGAFVCYEFLYTCAARIFLRLKSSEM